MYVVRRNGRLDEVATTWNEAFPRVLEFVGGRCFFFKYMDDGTY